MRTLTNCGLASLLGLMLCVEAPAQPTGPTSEQSPTPSGKTSLAIGSSLAWQYRRDFGNANRTAFAPELFATLSIPAPWPRVYFRPAARLGYVGIGQAEQPKKISIAERDVLASAEFGAVYDGPVIPSISVGVGGALRFISLTLEEPISAPGEDRTSRTQTYARVFGQLGLGLPVASGTIVLEPNLRYEFAFGDDRIAWRAGFDISYAL